MARNARDRRPNVKPVEKIQLSGENTTRRAVAAVLLLILGAAALAYSFFQLLTPDTGWQTIQAGTSEGATCGSEFTFLYELGAEGRDPRAEQQALEELYTRACRRAYQLFDAAQSFEDVANLRDVSAHPNETLTVDPALYAAFEAVQARGDRSLYLGPVWERYGGLFTCQDDSQLVDFDPWTSGEVGAEYASYAAYAADPDQIDMELLGENRIRLRVSEEYLSYVQQEEIGRFLDFGWMKNAFVADYLADTLVQAGFSCGVLISTDGFIRCLDSREGSFTLNLYGWEEGRPIGAGSMEYQGPMSLISLRAFPVTEGDWQRFYRLQDGQLRTPYLDLSDGKCRESVDSLMCWSTTHSCAELAMSAAPVFISSEFDPGPLEALAGVGMHSLWCQDRVFDGTKPLPEIRDLYQVDDVRYSLAEQY